MGDDTYIDIEILANMDDEYLVSVSKEVLHSLITDNEFITVRHWDGNKPVVLEPYGETAVRTRSDESSTNNLAELPYVDPDELALYLISEDES